MIEIDPSIPEEEQMKLVEEYFKEPTTSNSTNHIRTFVAKIAKNSTDANDRSTYFSDVEMQMYAKEWAKKFNSLDPPKKIDFASAWVVELIEREGKPLCAVENFIRGPFIKFNNNTGYVSKLDRNTPQVLKPFFLFFTKKKPL